MTSPASGSKRYCSAASDAQLLDAQLLDAQLLDAQLLDAEGASGTPGPESAMTSPAGENGVGPCEEVVAARVDAGDIPGDLVLLEGVEGV